MIAKRSAWTLGAYLGLLVGCVTHHAADAAAVGDAGSGTAGALDAGSGGAGRAVPDADSGSAGHAPQDAAALADAAPARGPCTNPGAELAVSGAERAGYPPYAVSGCSLLYVASDGALRLRELDTGAESEIAAAAELPTRPTLAGPPEDAARVMAWESGLEQAVRVRFGGVTRSVRGSYQHSAQPRATRDAVVMSAWVNSDPLSDADVLLYEPASQTLTALGTGAGQQLFADVSATQVAYSDFSEDPDGRFDDDGQDVADLVLVDRTSHTRRTLALSGKQAFPLFASAGQVVYLNWALGHPEPKLSAYAIMVWDPKSDRQTMLANVETQPPYVRPSVYGSTVEWIERPYSDAERLMRAQISGSAPELAFSNAGTQLYATASSSDATWMATLSATQSVPLLVAVKR